MTRQEKYPDTKVFHYWNANPKNRITGDCVVRALATVTEKPYNDIIRDLAELAIETGYSTGCKELYGRYLEGLGFAKYPQPRKSDNTKYTGAEFCRSRKIDKSKRIFAHIGGNHVVAIVEGRVWDIWDSTEGCIGNYWMK